MDPLHITEFASERYFSKLQQLQSNAEPAAIAPTNAPSSITTRDPSEQSTSTSTFNLPLADPRQRHSNDDSYFLKPSEQRKRSVGHDLTSLRTQRRPTFTGSFGSLRSKISLHKTASILELHEESSLKDSTVKHEQVTTGLHYMPFSSDPSSSGLGGLFLALPNELQAHIIAALSIHDILNLRLVSRSYQALVSLNESLISRYHVTHSLPKYTLLLYPLPDTAEISFHYLCGIWHRLHVAAKLSKMISDQATKEIFLRTTPARVKEFEPQHKRMQQRLMPLLFTLFHFFETYRNLHAQHLAAGGVPLAKWPYTVHPIECQVMEMYDNPTLLKLHQVYPLIMSCFFRRLRPPSYVGTVEKTLKGYLRDKPADDVYATILAVGGLRQAQRFWETKGYNTRRASVDTWFNFVTKSLPGPTRRTKKSFINRMKTVSLGNTKEQRRNPPAFDGSTPGNSGHDATSCQEWFCVKPTCMYMKKEQPRSRSPMSGSLALGPPMRPLPLGQLQQLVPDLQRLTDIWLRTAETLILQRQIVERPQDIKRNTQVLLELIRDDGTDGIDDWIHANSFEGSVATASLTTSQSEGLSD